MAFDSIKIFGSVFVLALLAYPVLRTVNFVTSIMQ